MNSFVLVEENSEKNDVCVFISSLTEDLFKAVEIVIAGLF